MIKTTLTGIALIALLTGCDCSSDGKPYYNICDDASCNDTLDYTRDGECVTYQKKFGGAWKTSCGEFRIYYKNGAKPKATQSSTGKVI